MLFWHFWFLLYKQRRYRLPSTVHCSLTTTGVVMTADCNVSPMAPHSLKPKLTMTVKVLLERRLFGNIHTRTHEGP